MKEREFRSRHDKKANDPESQDEGSVHELSQNEDTDSGSYQDHNMTVPGYFHTAMPKCSQDCKKYHKKPQEWYCFDSDCEGFICFACTAKDHRDHNFEFISKAAESTKEKLVKQLDSLTEGKTVLLRAIEGVQMTRLEIEDQGQSVVDNIESSFGELLEIVNNRKQELVRQTILTVMKKSKNLSEQENDLSTSYALVQSTIDLTEQCVAQSPDDELLLVHTDIQRRIREIEKQQKEMEDLEPVEEVDLGVEVNCAEDLKQLCQTKAKLTPLPVNGGESPVAVGGSAEVNEASQYHFELFPKLSNVRPTERSCGMACSLKSLANNSITECQVELIEGTKYRIQYMPTVRGRHELIVTVNGSPFPVFVSIHPTLLGKPVRVITGVKDPRDIAVTATGNIIVTSPKKLAILDDSGENWVPIDVSKFGLTDPWGVAVDRADGCIYIGDPESSKLIKLSADFKLIRKISASGLDRFAYRQLVVVEDEVMVCEGNRSVMVYTKDLKYVRQIGSHGDGPEQFKGIRGVSSDENSNLYITDCTGRRVQVFTNSGEFLYSVGQDEGGVKKLKHPYGICVAGQYVYVGDYGGNCVSVFTTGGEYVTSFGDFASLRGVCIDKDGFLYICDRYGNRIQVL